MDLKASVCCNIRRRLVHLLLVRIDLEASEKIKDSFAECNKLKGLPPGYRKRQALLDTRTASTKRNHDAKVTGATTAVQAAVNRARQEIDLSDKGGLVGEFGEAAVGE